ncbi:MAG TPA: PQQ-binding-like beta-propeller repeat protein, partial [Thermoanaerobaculia bacterium]
MFVAPAVAGERVVVGSCSGRVLALGAGDGELAWSFDTAADGARAQFHGEAVVDGELLLIGADGRPAAFVYALELATGRVRWKQAFPGGVPVDLLRHGRAVLGVSMAGEVFALDAVTGEPLWRVDDPPPGARDHRPLDAVLVGDRLVVPSRTGVVDAYRATDGERLWRRDLGASLNAAPLAIGDRVWIGGTDGRLRSFSAADGAPGPAIESSGLFYGDLVAAPGCIVALRAEGAPDGAGGFAGPHVVACFDPATGAERWR